MANTESSLSIQDEETGVTATVVTSKDDITIHWIVGLNPDWSSINPASDE